jgi:hypothetical protein
MPDMSWLHGGPTGTVHERAAKALGWSVKDTQSMSLASLREVVRDVNPGLANEISMMIQSGSHIVGERHKSRRRGRALKRRHAPVRRRRGHATGVPMTAQAFVDALRAELEIGDRQVGITVQPGYGFKKDESVYVNFINLPKGIGSAGGGAEAENNRASFWVRGFPGVNVPADTVKVEQSNSSLYKGAGAPSRETRVSMRAKTGVPGAVVKHLAAFLNKVARDVPPRFTHTGMP